MWVQGDNGQELWKIYSGMVVIVAKQKERDVHC